MNTVPLSPDWVRGWAADVTARVAAVLAAFDRYFPFSPGQNEIVPAGPDRRAGLDALRGYPGTAPDLLTFYGVIDEVVLSDIGNAFFIHPPGVALGDCVDRVAVGDGVVFASNGGGILYAIGPDGSVHRSRAASRDSGFDPVADDLRGFLEKLRAAVVQFAATRTPGEI
ncbi:MULTISPECIES: hypothetical protein [unclassified Streptomyces]|uniref:hypothetical protein n=1 Tax=unclassified Streptomyces TaxID=2593676 RepID=UPI00341AB176